MESLSEIGEITLYKNKETRAAQKSIKQQRLFWKIRKRLWETHNEYLHQNRFGLVMADKIYRPPSEDDGSKY